MAAGATSEGRQPSTAGCVILAACLAGLPLAGCVVYEPVPAYQSAGSNFDRAWNAALGAAQEAGIQVTTTDYASGLIRGARSGNDVVVSVARQGDGSVRVHFNAKGPAEQDPGLSERFSQAFDRRMGR